jgi:hypothetical protein
VALIVGYAVIFAVTITVVILVTVVWLTRGTGNLLTEPDAPATSVVEVLFHPYDFGPVKMPPVERGKGLRMVDVSVLRVVKVRYKVEWTVAVGEADVVGGTGDRVTVVMPIVILETGV